jgi:hypothetical protein
MPNGFILNDSTTILIGVSESLTVGSSSGDFGFTILTKWDKSLSSAFSINFRTSFSLNDWN